MDDTFLYPSRLLFYTICYVSLFNHFYVWVQTEHIFLYTCTWSWLCMLIKWRLELGLYYLLPLLKNGFFMLYLFLIWVSRKVLAYVNFSFECMKTRFLYHIYFELGQSYIYRTKGRKDETLVCGYTLWIYSLNTLENTDENRIFFFRSTHHKHFGKAQHLVLWALSWHQLFSTC